MLVEKVFPHENYSFRVLRMNIPLLLERAVLGLGMNGST